MAQGEKQKRVSCYKIPLGKSSLEMSVSQRNSTVSPSVPPQVQKDPIY